ncbi:caspace recruitment domain-containing protein [Three spot gourami iridovirus]|nr:caspace recruitment domain-containing protein [South American cichlid iridovirus]AVR29886.1 caspace recruitment domain-containing protein [Three spot gourami iridovirus]
MSFLTEFTDRHTLMLLMDGLVDMHALMPELMATIKCDPNVRDCARILIDNACRQGNTVSRVFMILCRSLQPTCAISVKYASMITQ